MTPNFLGRLQDYRVQLRRPGETAGWLGRGFDPLNTRVDKRDSTDNPYWRDCSDEELTFEIDGFRVDAMRLRHPGNTLGYRLTSLAGGASVAFVPDNELGPGGEYGEPADWREQFVRFLQGVDILIHDAMFRDEEVEEFAGWGHSSPREALAVAAEAGVKRLLLFHHRPEHDDDRMDQIVAGAQRQAEGTGVTVEAAVEGMHISL